MANLGNLFYEVQFKDSTSTGIKSIEDKIKKLNATITPKILVKDLKSELSNVSSKKGAEIKLSVRTDTKAIVADINNAISKNKFTAIVKANASSIPSEIKSAINSSSYVAKIAVDTSGIKSAVQSAVGESIKVKAVQDAGSKSQRSATEAKPVRQVVKTSDRNNANYDSLFGNREEKVVTRSGWIPNYKKALADFHNRVLSDANSSPISRKELKDIEEMQRYVDKMKGRKRANMQAMLDRRRAVFDAENMNGYVDAIRGMMTNPYRVMTVRHLPEKGSERYKALEVQNAIQRASRASDIKEAFKNEEALSKARETLSKINEYISKGGQLSPQLKSAQSALSSYVLTLVNAKRVENKETRAPLLYDKINRAASSATSQLKALNAETERQNRQAAKAQANRNALRMPLHNSTELLTRAYGFISDVNKNFPHNNDVKVNAYNALKPLLDNVQKYRLEVGKSFSNGTKADPITLSKLSSAVDALNAKMRELDKVASNIKLRKLNAREYAKEIGQITQEMQNVGSRGGWLRDQLQNVFSVYGAKQFLDNLIQIGGEFEKQKIALGALFGSKLKADTMYSKIQNLAVQSPFTFGELTNYTKQLASFGFEYKDIYDTTKRLADLSAGIGVDMNRVILAYGQVFTAKFLKGPELRQFTEAGIPLVQELADKFSKERGQQISAGQVYNMISEKQVRFEDVKDIIDKYTSEGGRFYKMQEKLSDSVSGKWSNMKDSIEIAYSEIASSSSGVLKGTISMLTSAILKWKLYGNIVMGAAAAYSLLAAKGRIIAFMSKQAASQSAMINQQTVAVEKQTAAYNKLAAALNKKNIAQGATRADGSWNSGATHRERRAAGREARRLILNGQNVGNITPLYQGAPSFDPTTGKQIMTEKDIAWLNKYVRPAERLQRQMVVLNKAFNRLPIGLSKCSVGFSKLWVRSKIALLGIKNAALIAGSAIKAMLVSMWPMLALTAAFSWFANRQEDKNERKEHAESSIEGFRQAYKELKDFVEANPIEIAIKSNNVSQIAELINAYTEQLRNSPINVDFALSHADTMTDMGKRLEYLRDKANEAADAANKVKSEAASISDAIDDATDNLGPDDQLFENAKDYVESLRNVEKEAAKVSSDDMNDWLVNLNANWNKLLAGNKTKQYKQDLENLRKTLMFYQRIGDSKGFVRALMDDKDKYGNQSAVTKLGFGLNLATLKRAIDESKDQYETFASDMEDASSVIMERLDKDSSAVVYKTLSNGQKIATLTDEGHMQMVSYIQDYANLHKLGAEETQAMIAEMEGKYRAADNATWQEQSASMDALIDLISQKTGKLFEKKDLSKGFSSEQKEAINRMIDELPFQFDKYKERLRQMCKDASSALSIQIGIRFHMLNSPASAVVSNAQDVFDKAFPGINIGGSEYEKYSFLRPTDQSASTEEMINGWRENIKRDSKTLKTLKSIKVNSDRNKKEIETLENRIKTTRAALEKVSPSTLSELDKELNKKDNTKRDKTQRERENKLRKYEKSKQEEYNQLKRVKDVFERLRELYGDVGALKKITDSGLFKKDFIPNNAKTREDFVKAYNEMLVKLKNSIKPKSDSLKKLIDDIEKEKFDISFQVDKDKLDEQVKILESSIDRLGDAWSRYKKLREDGFADELAGYFAFGYEEIPTFHDQAAELYARLGIAGYEAPKGYDWDDVIRMNAEEIKKAYGYDAEKYSPVIKYVEAYQKANKEIKNENDKLFADLYNNSKRYAEKIENIEAKKRRDIGTIREQGRGYSDLKSKYEDKKEEFDYNQDRLDYLEPGSDGYKKQLAIVEKLRKELEKLKRELGEKLPPDVVDRLVGERKRQALEEMGKLEWEEFQKSNNYMMFFQAVLSMSEQTMQSVYKNIKGYLDKAFQDGKMSAKDYYDNLQKLDEQRDKKENDTTKGRARFLNGRKGAAQWVVDHSKDNYESAVIAYNGAVKGRQDFEYQYGDKINNNAVYRTMQKGFLADEKRRKIEMEAAKTDLDAAKKHLKKIEETSKTIGKLQGELSNYGSITSTLMQMTEGRNYNGHRSKGYSIASGANYAVSIAQNLLSAADSFNQGDYSSGAASLVQAASAAKAASAASVQESVARRVGRAEAIGGLSTAMSNAVNKYGINTAPIDTLTLYDNLVGSGREALDGIKNALYKNNPSLMLNAMAKDTSKEFLKKEGFDKAKSMTALGAEYASLVQQRDYLLQAATDERSGSDNDYGKAADFEKQAAEITEKLIEFKNNVLKEIYGIDLTSFAKNLSSALVSAFKDGQDAAEAFANNVNSLLRTITENVITQAIIMPEVEKLMKQIEDVYDLNDPDSIYKVIDLLTNWADSTGEKLVGNAKTLYDGVNKRTGGKLNSGSGSSSSTSSSIKGLTEETGSLLASYINAIRADVSINRNLLQQVVEVSLPQMNVIAESQLKQLNVIVQQTKLIEENTRSNAEAANNIQTSLNSVLTMASGGKAVRIKA